MSLHILKIKVTILLLAVVTIATAFIYNPPPHKLTYLKLVIPKGWPKPPADIFASNPLTEEGFQLGRKLFYDGRLSKDGNFPCASCHQQFAAFTTYAHDFSHGFNFIYILSPLATTSGCFKFYFCNNIHIQIY